MNNLYGFDIEAVPLRVFSPEAKLLCASIYQDFSVSYVKDHYQREFVDEKVNLNSLAIIGSILQDKDNIISGHNISFDVLGWERFYKEQQKRIDNNHRAIKCQLFDTMIAHSLVGYKTPESNKLDLVAKKYLGHSKLDMNPKEIPVSPIDRLILYNNVDSLLTYELYEPLMNEVVDKGFENLFYFLMKILKVFIKMSIRGVKLDIDYIKTHREEVEDKLQSLESVLAFAFGDINFNSPQQLAKVLYEDLELPILEWTKTGNPSTGIDAIVKLRNSDEVHDLQKTDLQALLDYRKLKKINGTYLKPLEEKHLGWDGRVHAQYFLGKGYDQGINFGTISGRTSSSNPNLQNQPNEVVIEALDNFTVNIRRAFIPTEGMMFYKADYSQLEMRVAAYLSKDPRMLRVFKDGIDIHTYSLANVDGEDYDFIMEQLEKGDSHWKFRRRLIKTFNFALIYGASPFKLQMILLKELELHMEIDDIRTIVRNWNNTYRAFTKWRYRVYDLIYHLGYVRSETGRIRYFFEEGEGEHLTRKEISQCYREGLNDIIQSFASDIALFGTYYLYNRFIKDKIGFPLLPVHDSIEGEIFPEHNESKIIEICQECMIDKPIKVLRKYFDIDTRDLYLDIDVETHLNSWGG